MTNPDSYSDEHIILDSSSISIKGIQFRVILTNYRISLYNSSTQKQNDIVLSEVQKVKAESGLIGDPTLLLFILSQSGENKKMIFNFSPDRENERNRWITEINNLILANSKIPSNEVGVSTVNSDVINQQSDPFFCSRCGNKVTADSAFCNRCGTKTSPPAQPIANYQNTGNGKYTGESAKISTEKITLPQRKTQNIEVKKTHDLANDPYIPPVINAQQKAPGGRLELNLTNVGALCCGLFILLVIVSSVISAFAFGLNSSKISSEPQTSITNSDSQFTTTATTRITSDSSDKIITKSFSEFALTINDLPNGWMANGAPTVTENGYQSSFMNINTGSNAVTLTFSTTKYPTVDEAKTVYANQKSQVTDVKVNPINAGNEGFAYQDIVDTHAIFRKGNLIISISTTHYPSVPVSYLTPYAQLVSNRI
jgi:hypothetical protein